jgi:hypothetical protein
MMKELDHDVLDTVAGGSRKTDQLNSTLTQVTSSIKDLASQQNNNGSGNTTTMLMLALAMQNRNQTVVAQPATTVVAQPAFSFRARVRF